MPIRTGTFAKPNNYTKPVEGSQYTPQVLQKSQFSHPF
ncbi:MAG: hypothetical protein UZ09_BCD002001314 [Bacteroidetes bacterium OLB9]|nr:MAG: hypothetical protein UZ09_BCD002001314 [Bacteroidetes bacterium OLB9]